MPGQLILDRRIGQKILIGKDIIVEVRDVWYEGDRPMVAIGIAAPPQVVILRQEVPDDGTRRTASGQKYKIVNDRVVDINHTNPYIKEER